MAFITYPLNNIDYTAEDAELFHCTRTSGIWAENSFPISVTGADNNVTIGTGIAWINNEEFSGKVAALKSAEVLDSGIADSTYPRIDVIAIQFNANNNATDIIIKKGTPATNPVRPSIVRTVAIYELYLASIYRPAGAIAITASNITDLRMDETVCGLMADSVTKVDMTAIEAQVRSFINNLQNEIDSVRNLSGIMLESEWVDGDVIPVSKGGTGATSLADLLKVLCSGGSGNSEPEYVIGFNSNYGGSGYTSIKNLRNTMGLGNTTGTLPIANGGTGATTAAAALTNLGAAPKGHASTDTTYGMATSVNYGHVKLSGSVSNTSGKDGGVAATPSAVKEAYNRGTAGITEAKKKIEKIKLWENASPGSTLTQQTLSINLSGYNFIEVVCNYASGYPNRLLASATCPVKAGSQVAIYNDTNYRTITVDSLTAVSLNNANGSANNNVIPVYIFGIKGVQ